jgi:hypothetical protein
MRCMRFSPPLSSKPQSDMANEPDKSGEAEEKGREARGQGDYEFARVVGGPRAQKGARRPHADSAPPD